MTISDHSGEIKVVRGEPSAEELAAIVVVLRAQVKADLEKNKSKSEWNSPHRLARSYFAHGVGMWRRSALPH